MPALTLALIDRAVEMARRDGKPPHSDLFLLHHSQMADPVLMRELRAHYPAAEFMTIKPLPRKTEEPICT